MSDEQALTAEIEAVFRSDLMTCKAGTLAEMREAAEASMASLVPADADFRIVVEPDPDSPQCFRVRAAIVRKKLRVRSVRP